MHILRDCLLALLIALHMSFSIIGEYIIILFGSSGAAAQPLLELAGRTGRGREETQSSGCNVIMSCSSSNSTQLTFMHNQID